MILTLNLLRMKSYCMALFEVLFERKMSDSRHKRIMVTSALPYANGPVHLGHLAGAYLPADLYCRYERLKGSDLVYVCGSDEMGVAIMIRAQQQGITPRDIVDQTLPLQCSGQVLLS